MNFYRKINGVKCFSVLFLILMSGLFISGCGAGSGVGDESSDPGSFSMSVDWPEEAVVSESVDLSGAKMIPSGSTKIEVSITGEDQMDAIITTFTYTQTNITIDNIPAGNKIATIRALDSSNNVKAQRKESIIINSGETTTSSSIPLGIAVKGDSSNPTIEPSNLTFNYGKYIYFQNWTDSGITLKTNTYRKSVCWAPVATLNLPAPSTDGNGNAVYGSGKVCPCGITKITMDGKSNVGYVTASFSSYAYITEYTGFGTAGYNSINVLSSISVDANNKMYIGRASNIYRYDQGFTNCVTLASGVGCNYLTVDSSGRIYWNSGETTLKRMNSDGSGITSFCVDDNRKGICVDDNGYVYAARFGYCYLYAYNSDLSQRTVQAFGTRNTDITNTASGYLYSTDDGSDGNGNIYKVIYNGSSFSASQSWVGADNVYFITVDAMGNLIYRNSSSFFRLNPNTGAIDTLLTVSNIKDAAVDLNGNLYMCDYQKVYKYSPVVVN